LIDRLMALVKFRLCQVLPARLRRSGGQTLAGLADPIGVE
jgi:hypothetical protein